MLASSVTGVTGMASVSMSHYRRSGHRMDTTNRRVRGHLAMASSCRRRIRRRWEQAGAVALGSNRASKRRWRAAAVTVATVVTLARVGIGRRGGVGDPHLHRHRRGRIQPGRGGGQPRRVDRLRGQCGLEQRVGDRHRHQHRHCHDRDRRRRHIAHRPMRRVQLVAQLPAD